MYYNINELMVSFVMMKTIVLIVVINKYLSFKGAKIVTGDLDAAYSYFEKYSGKK